MTRVGASSTPGLAVIFAQYDREKYPRSLARLIGTLGRLEAVSDVVVVDNGVPGSWVHPVAERLVHLGGDNSAWEFSAFDRGLTWLRERGATPDVVVLATDAMLAYGESFLDLVDDEVVGWVRGRSAAVGWIDSFLQEVEILGHRCDAWLRTSLVFLPFPVVRSLGRLAIDLDDGALFSGDPRRPFRPDAPVSRNLQELLLHWLTVEQSTNAEGNGGWHSRFTLDVDRLKFFESKVKSILREQVLSARLRRLEVPCFDFRAIRELSRQRPAERVESSWGRRWQWLGWMDAAEPSSSMGGSRSRGEDRQPAWNPRSEALLPVARATRNEPGRAHLLLTQERADCDGAEREEGFVDRVLMLVRQRHPDVEAVGAAARPNRAGPTAVAALVPPGGTASAGALEALCRRGSALVGPAAAFVGLHAVEGRDFLGAIQPWEYAAACCRLIEEPALARRLGERARGLGIALATVGQGG